MKNRFEEYSERNSSAKGGLGMGKIIAAVLTLVLLFIGGKWIFGLGSSDPNDVPVVQAQGGVVREAPEESGGKTVDDQGLAVNDVLASDEASGAPQSAETSGADILLEDEDGPTELELADGAPAEGSVTDVLTDEEGEAEAGEGEGEIDIASIVDGAVDEALEGADDASEEEAAELVIPEGAIKILTPALPRPANATALAEAAKPINTEEAEVTAPAPEASNIAGFAKWDSVPSGTSLVQLGAFDSPAVAEAEWKRLSGANGDLLGGKTPVIQRIESGGRIFYRLRVIDVGDGAAARALCSALGGRNVPCLPANK